MRLICDNCKREEEAAPYCEGDKCYTGCGGHFINKATMHNRSIQMNKFREAADETMKDPNGKDQHEPGAKMDDGRVKAGILGDFSLALMEIARVGTYGSNKYTRHGWEEVPNGIERYHDAKWRHELACRQNRFDDESGLLHLAHEAWNTLAELELILRKELGEQHATI